MSKNPEIEKVLDKFLKKKNVIGGSLQIQPRIAGDEVLKDSQVLRVYVSRKEALSCLAAKDILPKEVIIDGRTIAIDVVEIGELKALSWDDPPISPPPDPQKKYRPLLMGISTMNARSTGACSLGTFARCNKTGKIVELSNQHCFGLENDAIVGDPIIQQSRLDGASNNEANYTGRFLRGVDIFFDTFNCPIRNTANKVVKLFQLGENRVDVSCGVLDNGIEYEMKTPNGIEITGWKDPTELARPWAYGRTSSYSYDGLYTDLSGYVTVGYRKGKAKFSDVVIGLQSDTFKCIPGDSGSPWFEEDKLVGLRFAGSDITWIGCKWSNIQVELDVSWI